MCKCHFIYMSFLAVISKLPTQQTTFNPWNSRQCTLYLKTPHVEIVAWNWWFSGMICSKKFCGRVEVRLTHSGFHQVMGCGMYSSASSWPWPLWPLKPERGASVLGGSWQVWSLLFLDSLFPWMCWRVVLCPIQCHLWFPVLPLLTVVFLPYVSFTVLSFSTFFFYLNLPSVRENCEGLLIRAVPNCKREMARQSGNRKCY